MARELGMTVGEMSRRLSHAEFVEWQSYYAMLERESKDQRR